MILVFWFLGERKKPPRTQSRASTHKKHEDFVRQNMSIEITKLCKQLRANYEEIASKYSMVFLPNVFNICNYDYDYFIIRLWFPQKCTNCTYGAKIKQKFGIARYVWRTMMWNGNCIIKMPIQSSNTCTLWKYDFASRDSSIVIRR